MKYRLFLYLLILVIFIFIWELLGSQSVTVRLLISSPTLVLNYTILNFSILAQATFTTFYEAMIGLILAVFLSFGLIVLCIYFPKLMDFILPVMVFSQVIPLVTLAPLFIILFGLGVSSKIAMASLMCFFPVFINFSTGVRTISINILELLFIYKATTSYKIVHVYFPLSLPHLMSGLKISATLSVIGAIVAEFNGADYGLGRNLFLAARNLEPELMMSSLFFSTVLGIISFGIILLIERNLGKWYLDN